MCESRSRLVYFFELALGSAYRANSSERLGAIQTDTVMKTICVYHFEWRTQTDFTQLLILPFFFISFLCTLFENSDEILHHLFPVLVELFLFFGLETNEKFFQLLSFCELVVISSDHGYKGVWWHFSDCTPEDNLQKLITYLYSLNIYFRI